MNKPPISALRSSTATWPVFSSRCAKTPTTAVRIFSGFAAIIRIFCTSTASSSRVRIKASGLGRIFYADVTSYAEVRVPLLACEVFLEPRDDVSVLFHGTYGFQEVGQQMMAGVNRRVALLAKDLPSYPFVLDTYLQGATGALPNQPWLAERERKSPLPAARAAGAS